MNEIERQSELKTTEKEKKNRVEIPREVLGLEIDKYLKHSSPLDLLNRINAVFAAEKERWFLEPEIEKSQEMEVLVNKVVVDEIWNFKIQSIMHVESVQFDNLIP